MIQKDVLLAPFTNYKIGGPAKYFLDFDSVDDLEKHSELIKSEKIFILGDGTNVLFPDDGFDGLILKNSIKFINTLSNNQIEVGSAIKIKELNDFCIEQELSGLEWSGGLPGSFGGAIFGNAGAFGGEIKDSIVSVKSYDLFENRIIERNNKECKFGYRNSIFKSKFKNKEIIISAVLQLKPGNRELIKQSIGEKIAYREAKQPLYEASAGSTFKNIPVELIPPHTLDKFRHKVKNDPFPVLPVAVLIADANLIGRKIGDAIISMKHPNFIVNTGTASAKDVKSLIDLVKHTIKSKYEVELEPEVIII